MASEYTPNYNLDLYASEDKPNLRDQYNAAMGKIDTQLKANANGVTNVSASVVAATTAANEAKQIAQDAEAAAENAAPINHASTEATYGLGGALKYGHVSLAQNITNPTIAEDGIAASPKAVYQFVNGGYAPKAHAVASTMYGAGTRTEYGHVKLTDDANNGLTVGGSTAATPNCVDKKIEAFKNSSHTQSLYSNASLKFPTPLSGSCGLYIDYDPVGSTVTVHLNNTNFSGTSGTSNNYTLTTLTAQYRPAHDTGALLWCDGTKAIIGLHVTPAGEVDLSVTLGENVNLGGNVRAHVTYAVA